jgi:hypothetical protein
MVSRARTQAEVAVLGLAVLVSLATSVDEYEPSCSDFGSGEPVTLGPRGHAVIRAELAWDEEQVRYCVRGEGHVAYEGPGAPTRRGLDEMAEHTPPANTVEGVGGRLAPRPPGTGGWLDGGGDGGVARVFDYFVRPQGREDRLAHHDPLRSGRWESYLTLHNATDQPIQLEYWSIHADVVEEIP